MNGFGAIALFYDGLFSADGGKWAEEVVKTVKKYAANSVGADVGSGTGYFTRALSAAGFSVTGVEISPQMLNAAVSIGGAEYVEGDIRNLKGFKNLGFVTAINDVINYIKPKELLKAFRSVYNCLASGGAFIFDYSSEQRLKEVIGNNMFGEDTDGLSYMWFNTPQKNGVRMDLTFFVKTESGLYEREEDCFFEYYHTDASVAAALSDAGFKTVKTRLGERVRIVAIRR